MLSQANDSPRITAVVPRIGDKLVQDLGFLLLSGFLISLHHLSTPFFGVHYLVRQRISLRYILDEAIRLVANYEK